MIVQRDLPAGSAAKWLEVHTGRHEELFYTAHGLGLQRRFFDHFLLGADGVTFTSAPLPAPLELTGPLRADLHVSTDGDDADLFLTLRAFAPGGREVTFSGANDPRAPLSQGWLRLSHRAVDPARSLPWRPWHPHLLAEPARPGQAYPVAVEMWPTCVVLPAGYQLALSVAGRDFARPQGTDGFGGSGPFAHDDLADRPPARTAGITRVHTGARTPSSLLLPVIG
jgi:predicted acyl esterase